MKIEHERNRKGRRWSVEVDPWVERALAVAIASALTGDGAILLGVLRAAVGG